MSDLTYIKKIEPSIVAPNSGEKVIYSDYGIK